MVAHRVPAAPRYGSIGFKYANIPKYWLSFVMCMRSFCPLKLFSATRPQHCLFTFYQRCLCFHYNFDISAVLFLLKVIKLLLIEETNYLDNNMLLSCFS